MRSLTSIKDKVHGLETKALKNENCTDIFKIAALIGLYQSLGGREDLVTTSKINHIGNITNYVTAAEIYISIMSSVKIIVAKVRLKHRSIYLHDIVYYIRQKSYDTLHKYHIEVDFEDLYTMSFKSNSIKVKSIQVISVIDVRELLVEFIGKAFEVNLENYMLDILQQYT